MPTFELYRDEKVTVWTRTKLMIEADTLEGAVQVATDNDVWQNHPQVIDVGITRYLDDTEVLQDPVPGEQLGSIEIVAGNDLEATLWTNAIPSQS